VSEPFWVDAHAHWAQAFPAGIDFHEAERRFQESVAQGVRFSVQGGVDPVDWQRQLALADHLGSSFLPVLGLHPWWIQENSEEACLSALELLESLLAQHSDRIVGMGELGLDFSKTGKNTERLQRQCFERQLALAHRWKKPLVLHIVHAHEVALELLGSGPYRGILHAFGGGIDLAARYTALGLKLSIGRGLADPGKFLALKRALPLLSAQDWVLESDGTAEHWFRVAQAASGLTGRPLAEIAAQTTQNLIDSGLMAAISAP
jgi:TatD DNase family protein